MSAMRGRLAKLSISVASSAVASWTPTQLVSTPITESSSNDIPSVATSGGKFVKILGAYFGLWDSCPKIRFKPHSSAADATTWNQDSSISILTKCNPGLVRNQSLVLSLVSSLYFLNISSGRPKAALSNSVPSFVSTGSQIMIVSGFQYGGNSFSPSCRIADSSVPFTSWVSDSCALSKTGSGTRRSRKSLSIVISVDMLSESSALEHYGNVALQSFNMSDASGNSTSNYSGFSHFTFEARGLGVVQELGYDVLFEGSSCSSIVWTSDSRIACNYAWPISRDRALLSVVILLHHANTSSAVSNDYVTNPVFVPASKPIVDTFVSDIFVKLPADVENLVATYARFGPIVMIPSSSARINTSFFQFGEILDADFLFYCNHTQVYLKNFLPVSVQIAGNVSLIAVSNGSHVEAPICFGNDTVVHTLPANSFATIHRVSIAFCPRSTLRAVALRLHFSVMNETGFPIIFQTDSTPFDLIVGGSLSLSSGSSDATLLPEFIAGRNTLESYRFHVLANDIPCNRLAFQYTAQLACVANESSSSITPFYTTLHAQRFFHLLVKGTIARACSFNVSGWAFGLAGKCAIYVTIPTFSDVAMYSASFVVVSGSPASAKIIGSIVSQLQEGDVIWSTINSGLKCLSLALLDEFNNTATKCQNSFVLFVTACNGTQYSFYSLHGSTQGVSDCNGTVSWCSVRTTRSGSIVTGTSSSFFNMTFPFVINVTGQGQAAQISFISPFLSNSTRYQGGSVLPPVTIALTNAVGTVIVGRMSNTRVIIRIRVVSLLSNRSYSRLLLGVDTSPSCPGGGDQFVNAASDSSTITIDNVTVCASGENIIVYDIGTVDEQGSFSILVPNAYSAQFVVQTGPVACFRLVMQSARLERTYTKIESDIFVELFDLGRNVRFIASSSCSDTILTLDSQIVSGNCSISVFSNDSSAKISAPTEIQVFSYSSNTSASRLSSVIIIDTQFFNSSNRTVHLVASSVGPAPLTFIGAPIPVHVTPLCTPGQFVSFGPHSANSTGLYEYLSTANGSIICTKCAPGTFSVQEMPMQCADCRGGTFPNFDNTQCTPCTGNTWAPPKIQSSCLPCEPGYMPSRNHDSCITLKYLENPPLSLISKIPFKIPPIVAFDNFNRTLNGTTGSVLISLVCKPPSCSALAYGMMLQSIVSLNNRSSAPEIQVVDGDSDDAIGSGYFWNLTSVHAGDASLSSNLPVGISVFHPYSITLLGPQPVITAVSPSLASFAGDTVITLRASAWALLSRMQSLLPNRSDLSARCHFSFSSNHSSMVSPSNYTFGSYSFVEVISLPGSDNTRRTCLVPPAPPLGIWYVQIVLTDGRNSSNTVFVETVCPYNHFLYNKGCQQCPSSENGGSFNEKINAVSIESCRCSIGSYGTFGTGCIRCPQLSGYNCTSPDQVLPVVLPGYYGDSSLLGKCSWRDTSCAALLTCPYGARACPGGGDKLCTQTDPECYTGLACSSCCPFYFSENGLCLKCPDASTSTTILAIMAVVVIVVAVLLSTSQSPSFTQSIKYFILGMNFFQNLVSIKLINIEWPSALLQMFNVLRFFSFSIAAVRPECSFSWTFETKAVVTLMLPIALSFLVCLLGAIHGARSCRRLFKQVQDLRAHGAKLPYMSLSSLVSCWIHVVFFRPVEWKPRYFMWFALSPYLESRALGRQIRTSSENWAILRSTLKSRLAVGRIFGAMQRSNKVQPIISDYDVKHLQGLLHDAELDARFASIVYEGRKFASGIFSIIALSFVGTLTSAIGVTICEERDGMLFLAQDPTIECNLSSSRYSYLFTIAIGAIALYGLVVPSFLLILLSSQWCKEMRAKDRSGFDALFSFLTSRYSSSCYLWESVIFVYKGLCVVIPAMYSGSPLQQSVSMMFVSLVYVVMLFNFSPFVNGLMNAVEKASAFSIFLMYCIAVLFVCEVEQKPILDRTQKALVAIFLCIVCAFSSAFCLLSAIYEYYFLLLRHRDAFISNWVRAYESSIGDALKEGMFLYFYSFYNAMSRRSIVSKKRLTNETIALLMSLKHSDEWKSGSTWFRFALYCKYIWNWLRFAVKRRSIAACKPMTVREALDHSEARLFQRLSKILHHLNNLKSNIDADRSSNDVFERLVRFCKRLICCKHADNSSKKTDSRPSTMLTELEPPLEFMSHFSPKFKFISETFPDESIRILITLLVFDRDDDMGDSRMAKAYLQLIRHELGPMKAVIRSIFSIVSDIARDEKQAQKEQKWIVRFLKNRLLGFEGACLSRFLTYSDLEIGEFFADKGFEGFSKPEMTLIPVIKLVSAASEWQRVVLHEPLHRHRKQDLNSDSAAGDNLTTSLSTSTPLRYRSSSATAMQIFQPSLMLQRARPQMLRAKTMSVPNVTEQLALNHPSTSESDSILSQKLNTEQQNNKLMAVVQSQKEEISILKAQNEDNLVKLDKFQKEISILNAHYENISRAKDQEMSDLQATVARLMKRCMSLAQAARVPAVVSDPPPNTPGPALFADARNRSRIHFQEPQELHSAGLPGTPSSSDSDSAADV